MSSEIRRGASIPQVAAMYQVSEGLLYKLANEGKLPGCRRLGGGDGGRGRFIVHLETFEAYLASGMGDERSKED